MSRNKDNKAHIKLRKELDKSKGIFSKKKLITVMCLCCISMALPLPYIIQIPLLIYFGVTLHKSKLTEDAKIWFSGLDKYAIRIWTAVTIVFMAVYLINIAMYWVDTYKAFGEVYTNLKEISWAIPMCVRYTVLQIKGISEFSLSLSSAGSSLSDNQVWQILSKYDFIAFSGNYIDKSEYADIAFKSLASPLLMIIRLNKIKSLITLTGTAWVLFVSRFTFYLKSKKYRTVGHNA